jgi:hypothetical protein
MTALGAGRDDWRTLDDVDEILRLVSEGHMSPQEADAFLGELEKPRADSPSSRAAEASNRRRDDRLKHARIEVTERGRSVVNMRVPIVPLAVGRYALSRVPGLSESSVEQITNAIERGLTGQILQIQDEDGDGVRIVVE